MKVVAYLWTTKKYLPVWLESQQEALVRYASRHKAVIVGRVVENRAPREARLKGWPKLRQILKIAKKKDAILVIPRLYRLVRSPSFLSILKEEGVKFRVLDDRKVNLNSIDALIAAAEEFEGQASQRQRDALAVARESGVKLGSARPGHWKGREHLRGQKQATVASAQNRTLRAREAYRVIEEPLRERVKAGWSYQAIADWLTIEDHLTTAGKPFTGTAVWRIVQRMDDVQGIKPDPERTYKPPIKVIQKLARDGLDLTAITRQLAKDKYALPDGRAFNESDVQKLGRLKLVAV